MSLLAVSLAPIITIPLLHCQSLPPSELSLVLRVNFSLLQIVPAVFDVLIYVN